VSEACDRAVKARRASAREVAGGRGQGEAAFLSYGQLQAKLIFQRLKLAADRALGQVEFRCGGRGGAVPIQRLKG